MFKRFKYILGAILILMIISVSLYLIIITSSPIGIIKSEDTGAWFGFYGSILGGSMTLAGVWWTIKEQDKLRKADLIRQEKKRKYDIRELEKRRLEDRRISIAPFLSYIVDNELEVRKTLPSCIFLEPKDFKKTGDIEIDIKAQIIVQNIGLGVAVNPYILEIFYDNTTTLLGHETNIYLNVNDKAVIPLSIVLPKQLNKLTEMKIKLGYFNILQDFYEQTIIIDFIITPAIIVDENHVPIRTEYECKEIRIINVERPILSDHSKYKGVDLAFIVPDDMNK